jgi:glucan-binding YG repeat protein
LKYFYKKAYSEKMASKKMVLLGLTMSLSVNMPWSLSSYAASTHNKIGDSTYQLRDGTAISGVYARGIDVSHWQGTIDWNLVAQNDVSFVMLGTRYNGQVDPRFHTNALEASNAGIQLGIYIYSYATNTAMAEAEADFVLDLIKDYPISYPVAFDVEASVQSTLSPGELANIINAFCRKIEDAGYHAILYANDYWLANKIDMSQVHYDVWVARYETRHVFENPVMWQSTNTGAIDGINGNVDIDFQFRDFSDVIIPNLWRTIGGNTYYFQNHRMQKDSWIHDGTGWFFMDENGLASSGWMTQNGSTYYLDPDSRRMTEGWRLFSEGWRYFNENGVMQYGWVLDKGTWYYLNTDALMQTGWLQDENSWYYLKESGAMTQGWCQINGGWYYFNNSGAMLTGQQQIGDSWYYFDGNGAMLTGPCQIGENWYYFEENGAMGTGLKQINNAWYYFNDSDGIMITGWQQINGAWYYFGNDGIMQTGWVNDPHGQYYLNPENGAMFSNTQIVVDGITYEVDASGICREVISAENGNSEGLNINE